MGFGGRRVPIFCAPSREPGSATVLRVSRASCRRVSLQSVYSVDRIPAPFRRAPYARQSQRSRRARWSSCRTPQNVTTAPASLRPCPTRSARAHAGGDSWRSALASTVAHDRICLATAYASRCLHEPYVSAANSARWDAHAHPAPPCSSLRAQIEKWRPNRRRLSPPRPRPKRPWSRWSRSSRATVRCC